MLKKVMAVALTVVMGLSIVGCGSKDTKEYNSEVKLGKYKGLVVYKKDITASDEYIQEQLDSLIEASITLEEIKKVKKNSIVNVNYSGEIEVNGEMVAFSGGTAESQDLDIANNSTYVTSEMAMYGYTATPLIEGFTDDLVGHKVGDTVISHMKFPDDYGQSTEVNGETIDLSGVAVDFTFTINSIKKEVVPKLTDEFAAEQAKTAGLDDIKTVDDLKEYFADSYRKSQIMTYVWQDFVDSCEVKWDDDEIEALSEEYKDKIQKQQTMSFDQYLEVYELTEKEWLKSIKEEIKVSKVIRAVAEKEKLTEGIDKEKESMAEMYSYSVEEMESIYDAQYSKGYVETQLLYQRVVDFICDHVEVKKGSAPEETTEAK